MTALDLALGEIRAGQMEGYARLLTLIAAALEELRWHP